MSDNEKKTELGELMNQSPKYPERAAERTPAQCEGVYAGPTQMPRSKPSVIAAGVFTPSAMMTYAGPGMMNQMAGAFVALNSIPAEKTEQAPDPSHKPCRMCGFVNPGTAKFCSECGNPLSTSNPGSN